MPRACTAWKHVALLVVWCVAACHVAADDLPRFAPDAAALRDAYRRAAAPAPASGRVYKDRITPHWFDGDARFWYRNDLPGGTREFILVECGTGTRAWAFDHAKLAAALSNVAGKKYAGDHLPFNEIEFTSGVRAVRFRVGPTQYECDLTSYTCRPVVPPAVAPSPRPKAEEPVSFQPPRRGRGEVRTPDGRWSATVREFNIVLTGPGGKETRLTTDGRDGRGYGMLAWSPDSRALVAFRTEPAERKPVYRIESSPKGSGRAVLQTAQYALPGDKFTTHELRLFDPASGRAIPVAVDPIDFGFPSVRWDRDGRYFTYQKVDRGHQRFRLIRVDAHTGEVRNLIDEKTDTFIWTAHAEYIGTAPVKWLEKTDELIYASEKDGWRHLYLLDARTGREKNRITTGEWVVRGIDRIDEEKRQVWFRAGGRNPGEDPYHVHFYRVNFDGTGLTALTGSNGTHAVQFSPGREYVIDTYSRVDLPPVHELRRANDGKLVCKLDEADATELRSAGRRLPEVFTAKGRDGTTDIWGAIWRPVRLDPGKKYPVIEHIYAGPHGAHVPKSFAAGRRFDHLTELGFVVVMIDGMGTAHRSKAFHDVCWKNLKDAGFPDRVLWHKAAAAKYPWYDATRVGIYGTSAGGQNAAGALLFHGDFYSAAVAACGCHDNRMDKASWNEQWMGYPVGPQYAASSNIDNARRLTGKLLLIVGELDDNVPPESTYRFCDALIKAGKDFEFLMVPGMRHSDGGPYGRRRLQDFFVRHLHGLTSPDRNAATQ